MTTANVDYGRKVWDGFGFPGLSREASDEMRQHIASPAQNEIDRIHLHRRVERF